MMRLRHAARQIGLCAALGLHAVALAGLGLAGIGPLQFGAAQADLAPAPPPLSAQLGTLCRKGAPAPMMPLTYGLPLLARDWAGPDPSASRAAPLSGEGLQTGAMDAAGDTAVDAAQDAASQWPLQVGDRLFEARPWPQLLQAAAAGLPPDLQDLPWLLTLAEAEAQIGGSASSLAFGALAMAAPEFETVLTRHGLHSRARLFAAVQLALPPEARSGEAQVAALVQLYQAGDAEGAPGRPLLQAIALYPVDDALLQLVHRLALADAALRADLQQRLAALPAEARLDWLVQRLEAACGQAQWQPTDAAVLQLSQAAPAPRALLVLAAAEQHFGAAAGSGEPGLAALGAPEQGGLADYLSGEAGQFAPELLQELQIRGLLAEAAALEQAMALFPKPYPRDSSLRQELLEQDEALWTRLDAVALPQGTAARLRHEMLQIATEAGLMPLN